ncbi:MAG: ribonuclease R [Nitrospinae bacterium]|nr:ribonuclease R [Nitrospinota bacterium]
MKLSESAILKLMHEKTNRPMKISELAKCLAIPDVQRAEFRNYVKDMTEEGSLIRIRGGRYGLPDEMSLVSGTIQGHPDGYGFLVCDKPGPDIYIGRKNMENAMHLDRVMARVESRREKDRLYGRVIRILERKTVSLVGVYETFERQGWVIPSERKYFHDIFIPAKDRKGAKDGQIVCLEIVSYPTKHQPPVGRVVEVLGRADDPEAELQSVLRKHLVRRTFPEDVLEQTRSLADAVDEDERTRRKDLTDWTILTIDGEKAKDFDDAVSIEKTRDGYRLGVHIADVGHYVEENSPVDREAYERGTSIYYPDGVVPMLPFALSNEICSLKPGVERLTLTVLMDFDEAGELLKYDIFDSIIKSRYRFTYTGVARVLENGEGDERYQAALPTLELMRDLSQTLRKRRFDKGSVDFKIPEPEIVLNAQGKVEKIVAAEHNIAHELIEEFMLSANQVVARHLSERDIPSIHRVHERPDEAKIVAFNEFVKSFGLKLAHLHNPSPKDLQNLLKKALGRPEERVVNTVLLRAMKKALYSEKDPGHFCLAFEHYTHFTSPIRRYPDLVTHRTVKRFFKSKCTARERQRLLPRIADFAEQSSRAELKAMEVEREINDLRRVQFMADKVNEVYSGTITGVTAFGFFVELTEAFVEGLVHVSSLMDDYYIYLEAEHKLKGQHKHKTYQIGDPVKVRVTNVDVKKRQIDLTLVKNK